MPTIRTRTAKGAALSFSELETTWKRPSILKTAAYTVDASNNRDSIEVAAATPVTITLGVAATLLAACETTDYAVTIKNLNASAVTVSRSGTDTLDGATSFTLLQHQAATFKINAAGTSWSITSSKLLDTAGQIPDSNIPATIARDAEVTTAISNHVALPDPHAQYALDTDLSAHVAAGNPHSQYLLGSAYTAADVLAKVLTVDGSGSGLDADLLDGISSASFARVDAVSNFTAAPTIFSNSIRHDGNIFHGRVEANGIALRLPAGWTSVKISTGTYTLTHNLGTLNTTQVASNLNGTGSATIRRSDANSMVVNTVNASGVATDLGCNFMVIID